MSQTTVEQFIAGLETLGLSVNQKQIDQLLNLLVLLQKWNRTYNLTAIKGLHQMIVWHLLDSLALSIYIDGDQILDVGTGAGFPGLPLAIIHPLQHFVLLDSNLKKTRFVQQAVFELGIDNVEVVHTRIQDYQPEHQFDTVFARAVSSLADMVDNVTRLVNHGGRILLPKGQFPQTEITGIIDYEFSVIKLDIPGMDAQRHLVMVDC
ncbi:MAG TPA: 16S rRNA (guanine(527)-N(7))-methyltransferase RsmG [Crenotrichaceae bacterium]|nr:16S rRNA (guanine(527)-N(7))-methyltransferase RsmG [Crenotrichaceae bacterium]